MHLVIVTSFYPSPIEPQRAVFVQNLLCEMSVGREITLIAPLLLALIEGPRKMLSAMCSREIPFAEEGKGYRILRPRFVVVPGLWSFAWVSYFFCIFQSLLRLKKVHGEIAVHCHNAYPDAVAVSLACRILRAPYVVTAHGSDINVYAQRPVYREHIRRALMGARGIIAVSKNLRDKMIKLTDGSKSITYLPCAGFSPSIFYPLRSERIRNSCRLLYVGNFMHIKGVDVLVDAAAILHKGGAWPAEARVVLVGAGPERVAIQQRIHSLGVAGIFEFAGVLSQAQIADLMREVDLMLLPSRNEGTPNVMIEAFACGLPVVASRVGGIPEILIDGVNGFLVNAEDPGGLANAITRALAAGWDSAQITGSVSGLTWQNLAKENWKVLDSLMNGKGDEA